MKYLFLSFLLCSQLIADTLTVLVLDTGIDLKQTTITQYVPKEYLIEANQDTNSHGTFIAYTIAKRACPGVVIVPFHYYKDYNHFGNELKGIEKAIELKVDIINFSGGGDGYRPNEKELIKKFLSLDKNKLFIAAAGNDNEPAEKFFPAAYNLPQMVGVGALDKEGKKSEHSNYATWLKWRLGINVVGMGINNTPTTMSGTSASTALYTAGIVEDWCKAHH